MCMITGGLTVSISHVLTAFMPNITGVIFSLGVFGGKQMVVKNNVQYNKLNNTCYCSCQNRCRDRLLGNIGKFNVIVKRWIKTNIKITRDG